MALNAYAPHLPELLGGSADLTSSNLTNWEGVQAMRPDTYLGRHINYGVREFGMCAIMNGIALYGGFIPYGATFLTFADYGRNALRMAALMKLRSIFVFTRLYRRRRRRPDTSADRTDRKPAHHPEHGCLASC